MGNSKGNNLGEFEELVLLVVGTLHNDAYSVAVRNYITNDLKRKVNISAVHEVLKRLERKQLLTSHMGDATEERGGRRKKLYTLTTEGKTILIALKEQRDRLFGSIPGLGLSTSGI